MNNTLHRLPKLHLPPPSHLRLPLAKNPCGSRTSCLCLMMNLVRHVRLIQNVSARLLRPPCKEHKLPPKPHYNPHATRLTLPRPLLSNSHRLLRPLLPNQRLSISLSPTTHILSPLVIPRISNRHLLGS